MKFNTKDIIRQNEILALIFNGARMSKQDLADYFEVETITIERDLRVFRDAGIDIGSKKNIVGIYNKPDKSNLIVLAADYLPLKLNSDVFHKQVKSLAKVNPAFYQYLVLISKAVKEGKYLDVVYTKLEDDQTHSYKLKPVRLVSADLNWILQAYKDGCTTIQTFYLSRIVSLNLSGKAFKSQPIPEENKDKMSIVLKFNHKVKRELNYKIFFDEFTLEELPDGYILLKTSQPISNSLAGWCISWWDMIKVVEPNELREYIRNMVDSYLSTNKL